MHGSGEGPLTAGDTAMRAPDQFGITFPNGQPVVLPTHVTTRQGFYRFWDASLQLVEGDPAQANAVAATESIQTYMVTNDPHEGIDRTAVQDANVFGRRVNIHWSNGMGTADGRVTGRVHCVRPSRNKPSFWLTNTRAMDLLNAPPSDVSVPTVRQNDTNAGLNQQALPDEFTELAAEPLFSLFNASGHKATLDRLAPVGLADGKSAFAWFDPSSAAGSFGGWLYAQFDVDSSVVPVQQAQRNRLHVVDNKDGTSQVAVKYSVALPSSVAASYTEAGVTWTPALGLSRGLGVDSDGSGINDVVVIVPAQGSNKQWRYAAVAFHRPLNVTAALAQLKLGQTSTMSDSQMLTRALGGTRQVWPSPAQMRFGAADVWGLGSGDGLVAETVNLAGVSGGLYPVGLFGWPSLGITWPPSSGSGGSSAVLGLAPQSIASERLPLTVPAGKTAPTVPPVSFTTALGQTNASAGSSAGTPVLNVGVALTSTDSGGTISTHLRSFATPGATALSAGAAVTVAVDASTSTEVAAGTSSAVIATRSLPAPGPTPAVELAAALRLATGGFDIVTHWTDGSHPDSREYFPPIPVEVGHPSPHTVLMCKIYSDKPRQPVYYWNGLWWWREPDANGAPQWVLQSLPAAVAYETANPRVPTTPLCGDWPGWGSRESFGFAATVNGTTRYWLYDAGAATDKPKLLNTYAASFVPGGKLPAGAALVFANTVGTCSLNGQTPPGTTTPINAAGCDNPVVRAATSVALPGTTTTYGEWRAKTTTAWSGASTQPDLRFLDPVAPDTEGITSQALAINWKHPGATTTGAPTGLAAVTPNGVWSLVVPPTSGNQVAESVVVQWRPDPSDDDNSNHGGLAADTAGRPVVTFLAPN